MIEMCRVKSRHRGIEAGVRYAEAFQLVPMLNRVRLSRALNSAYLPTP